MFTVLSTLPKPLRGQTLYCNCQKETCFPCQHTATILANTDDGSLQLCRQCRKEYENGGAR